MFYLHLSRTGYTLLPCCKLCWQTVCSICDEDVPEKEQIHLETIILKRCRVELF